MASKTIHFIPILSVCLRKNSQYRCCTSREKRGERSVKNTQALYFAHKLSMHFGINKLIVLISQDKKSRLADAMALSFITLRRRMAEKVETSL